MLSVNKARVSADNQAMKLFYLIFTVFSFTHAFAANISLPRGGDLSLHSTEWSVQELKEFGVHSLVFSHKKLKNLTAVVLDGTVKEKGECTDQKTVVCERTVPMGDKISYQIIGQKYHGDKAYQNYIIAFTVNRNQEKEILPVLKKLKSQLEFKK